jgi:hypothetical protein
VLSGAQQLTIRGCCVVPGEIEAQVTFAGARNRRWRPRLFAA